MGKRRIYQHCIKHALVILLGLAILAACWHLHGYHSAVGKVAAQHAKHKPKFQDKIMPLPTATEYKNNTGRTKEEEQAYVTDHLCNRSDTAVPADLLPHTMHSWKKSKACIGEPMLVLVRTGHKEVHTRVPRIEDTWARKVPKGVTVEAMYEPAPEGSEHLHAAPEEDFVHDDIHFPKLPLIDWRLERILVEKCKKYERQPQLLQCCKTAEMLWYANLRIKGLNASWIFIVDDDAYVFLENLQLKLCEEHEKAKSIPTAFGVLGCAKDGCSGFCGGGGIGFSRVGLELFFSRSPRQDRFIQEFMDKCRSCGQWDDISVGNMAKARGLHLEQLPGLSPWRMSPEQQVLRMMHKREMPLIWHYQRENMYNTHKLRIWAGAAPLLLHFADAHGTYHGTGTDHPHDCLVWSHARADTVKDDPRAAAQKIMGVSAGVYKASVFSTGAGCRNTALGLSLGRYASADDCMPSALVNPQCILGNQWAFAMKNVGGGLSECYCCHREFEAAPPTPKPGQPGKYVPSKQVYSVEAWTTIQSWRPSTQILGSRLGTFLSTVPGGENFDLFFEDDASGRQRFVFTKGGEKGEGDWYTIQIYGGCVPGKSFFSASPDGRRVSLVGGDTGSGRERWVVQRGSSSSSWYNIKILGGTRTGATFLSAAPDGSTVQLVPKDDKSGLQRWVVELPPRPKPPVQSLLPARQSMVS